MPEEPSEVPASVVEISLHPEDKTVHTNPRLIEIDTMPMKINIDKVPATVRTIPVEDKISKPSMINIHVAPSTETVEVPIQIQPLTKYRPKPKLHFEWLAPKLYTSMYPFLHPVTRYGTPLPLHVIFVIDNSDDIRQTEFDYIRRFLQGLIYKPRPDWKIVRYGVITTANRPEVIFGLTPANRVRQLLPRLRHMGGVANLVGALDLASEIFRNYPSGPTKNVAIVLSANSPSCRRVSYYNFPLKGNRSHNIGQDKSFPGDQFVE
jgi:hypothetical protein